MAGDWPKTEKAVTAAACPITKEDVTADDCPKIDEDEVVVDVTVEAAG